MASTQTLLKNRELDKAFRVIKYLGLGRKKKQNTAGRFKKVVVCSYSKLLVAMTEIPLPTQLISDT